MPPTDKMETRDNTREDRKKENRLEASLNTRHTRIKIIPTRGAGKSKQHTTTDSHYIAHAEIFPVSAASTAMNNPYPNDFFNNGNDDGIMDDDQFSNDDDDHGFSDGDYDDAASRT